MIIRSAEDCRYSATIEEGLLQIDKYSGDGEGDDTIYRGSFNSIKPKMLAALLVDAPDLIEAVEKYYSYEPAESSNVVPALTAEEARMITDKVWSANAWEKLFDRIQRTAACGEHRVIFNDAVEKVRFQEPTKEVVSKLRELGYEVDVESYRDLYKNKYYRFYISW